MLPDPGAPCLLPAVVQQERPTDSMNGAPLLERRGLKPTSGLISHRSRTCLDQRGAQCRFGVAASDSESLRKIELPIEPGIWLAAGVTMRRGFHGLSAQVQTVLEQQPYSGSGCPFVFRGRRGDIVKWLWFDGDGLCLFSKRLERGRFIWPKARSGSDSSDSRTAFDAA